MFYLAKYNTQTTFTFPLVKRGVVDLAISTDYTPAAADSSVSKDQGNTADTSNTVTAVTGAGTRSSALWKLTLTATELSAAEIVVQVVDAATKAIEDQVLIIYTYGNASAKIAFDLSVATQAVNATQWLGGTIPAVNVTGVPLVDLKYTLGTISPATAGSVRADAVTGAVGSVTGAVGSVTGAVGSVTGAVGSVTGNVGGTVAVVTTLTNLPAIPANWLTAAGIAASALNGKGDWNVGKTGYAISATGLALQTAWTVAITGNITGNLSGSVGSVTGLTASDVGAIKTKTDSLTFTVAGMADANVVDWKGAAAPAMTGDAFARLGVPAGASVSVDIAAIKTETAAINAKTTNLPASPADETLVIAATNAIMSRLGAPSGASVSADVAAAKVDTAAIKVQTDKLTFTIANQVDSNVLDWKSATAPAMTGDAYAALVTTTRAEPGQSAPGATIAPMLKLDFLYKAWRNQKTQSATEFDLYADDATTVDQKSAVSDSGTVVTRGEMASGP